LQPREAGVAVRPDRMSVVNVWSDK
jgi:hypothetical protein